MAGPLRVERIVRVTSDQVVVSTGNVPASAICVIPAAWVVQPTEPATTVAVEVPDFGQLYELFVRYARATRGARSQKQSPSVPRTRRRRKAAAEPVAPTPLNGLTVAELVARDAALVEGQATEQG